MQIPSVSSIFQAKLSDAGIGRASAGFAGEYDAALRGSSNGADGGAGNITTMTVAPSGGADAVTQAVPLGWTQPQALDTSAQNALVYSDAMRSILANQFAASAAAPSEKAATLVNWAKQFVGTPYVRGGEDLLKGADCSGFTQSVFKQFGVSLPRSAYRQSMVGTPVDPNNLQPGDLMFFKTDDYAPVTHVAIYIGDNKILHASSVKTGVIISNLKKNWQSGDFVCAKRML